MTNLTEQEFKMMDLEFRTRASRLCRAKYQEVKMLLSKFLYYLEHTPVLNEYIQSCDPHMPDEAIRAMADNVARGWGKVSFDFGNDVQEETGRQYRVLKYADDAEDVGRIFAIGRAFDHDSHLQSSVEGFIHGVVNPFVDNITLYIHSIAMNVCSSPEKNITINATGNYAQINIAQDNACLAANQANESADWNFISEQLRKVQIAEEDIRELKSILETEKPTAKENLGSKINGWIAKIMSKVADGIVNLPFETAASVLTTLICKYYGW